jgi:ubiquinone/menaquinone biosynthesis C-methylase UbiE
MSNDAYRWVARWYDRLFEPMNSGLRSIGLKILPPREGMAVLDVGCGTGAQLGLYQRRGCAVSGIDQSPAMLQIARKRLGGGAGLYLGDATEMPFSSGSFDLAIFSLVLHEMNQATLASIIDETKRVLNDDGCILVTDYHPGPARPLKGWFVRAVILISELAAGRRHFRCYREFIALKGLPHLASQHRLAVEMQRIVAGGNLGIYLLRPEQTEGKEGCR